MRNRKGQGLLEFLVGSGVLLLFILVSAPWFYFGFTKLWVRHCAYEALICLLEQQPTAACTQQMNQRLLQFLKLGQLEKSWSKRFSDKVSSRVEFRINSQ
ncbi:MAG: hypothetical protein AB7F59_14385 [Bdellovibrionales bacterium]